MHKNEKFMHIALELAKKAEGNTWPNPMVGAVLVDGEKIVGKGYHKKAGKNHAEIEALIDAGSKAKGSTLYLNLEPCSHYGKTPPCVEAIINSGVSEVVCATVDPNPSVNGNGIKKLKDNGINVITGMNSAEALKLNEAYFTFYEKKRPFIALKYAASKNNRIPKGDGKPVWVTNLASQQYAKELRKKYMSILVGINTVLADDPNLGSALRIIIDPNLKITPSHQVLRNKNVLIVTTKLASKSKVSSIEAKGFDVLQFNEVSIPLTKLLNELKKRQIISVFVEGGPTTQAEFIKTGIYDKVYAFYGTKSIDMKNSLPIFNDVKPNLKADATTEIGNDKLVVSYSI